MTTIHQVEILTTHAHDGGHTISAFITQYGRGDWREGVTGSIYSKTSSDSAQAPNKAQAIHRARARLSDMAASAAETADRLASRYPIGSPGHAKFSAIAMHYRAQQCLAQAA